MPEGVNVELDGEGNAHLAFPDPEKRGPALRALLDTGAPIQTVTGGVLGFEYIVPEGNAREAGLLDESRKGGRKAKSQEKTSDESSQERLRRPDNELTHTTDGRKNDSPEDEATALEKELEVHPQLRADVAGSDSVTVTTSEGVSEDGTPTKKWTREEIDAYGATLDPPVDTTGAANKTEALKLLGVEEEN